MGKPYRSVARCSIVVASFLLPVVLACSSPTEADLASDAAAINKGFPDTVMSAIGYLRPVGTENEQCSLTLIEPNIALSSAHCFGRFANQCESAADVARTEEVVFSPRGDDTDRFVFAIDSVATAPLAYAPSIGACGGAVGGYNCGDLPPPKSGNDVALIKLKNPVPPSVARPIRVVTSATNWASSPHGVHANLESSSGPVLAWPEMPPAVVGGWGISKNCDHHQRRLALMDFTGAKLPYQWHRGCQMPQNCDTSYVYTETTTCSQIMENAPMLAAFPFSVPYDMFRLSRTSSKVEPETYRSIYDGPIINDGDSGGPLLMWLIVPPAVSFDFYVVGSASASNNYVDCGSDPPDRFLIADYSVAFSSNTGAWIERTISAWLDPPGQSLPPGPICRGFRCLPGPFER